jgi:nucleolar GTP-binding protein
MNFQDLTRVEKPNHYLDIAIKNSKKELSKYKQSLNIKDNLDKQKKSASYKMNIISKYLSSTFFHIMKSFPNIDSLPEFYMQLIRTQLDYGLLKKSLGSLNFASEKALFFSKMYSSKIKGDLSNELVQKHYKEYLGRISSILFRIKKNLEYLEYSRQTMKSFPSVKTGLFTVALYGFPNVGKSTILSKLTTSKPKIDDYSFTTRTINIGYIKEDSYKIQVLDTPGTLNRIDKMNEIEMQAELSLKYCADLVVFVYDPTIESDKQLKLLKKLKTKLDGKKLIKYASKSDICKDIPEGYITDINKLKKEIINSQ